MLIGICPLCGNDSIKGDLVGSEKQPELVWRCERCGEYFSEPKLVEVDDV